MARKSPFALALAMALIGGALFPEGSKERRELEERYNRLTESHIHRGEN